jgi:acetyl-CoA synthetase
LIGPFEVEGALLEHPAVAVAGAIGVPDPTAGEVVKTLVLLRPGFEPSEGLRREIRAVIAALTDGTLDPADVRASVARVIALRSTVRR